MFFMDKMGGMHITRGDSVGIATMPCRLLDDGTGEPIILDDAACVIFTVKSRYSGRTLIKRILTSDDAEDDRLTMFISSGETDAEPDGYAYSFVYLPDRNSPDEAYTYAQGEFELMNRVSSVNDMEVENNAV